MNSQDSLGWDQKWAIYPRRCQAGEGTFLNKGLGLGPGYNPILGFSWMAGIRRRFDSIIEYPAAATLLVVRDC